MTKTFASLVILLAKHVLVQQFAPVAKQIHPFLFYTITGVKTAALTISALSYTSANLAMLPRSHHWL